MIKLLNTSIKIFGNFKFITDPFYVGNTPTITPTLTPTPTSTPTNTPTLTPTPTNTQQIFERYIFVNDDFLN